MSIILPSIKKVSNKTEGTSQTYGQLVVFPSRRDISSLATGQPSAVSPVDTVVKIVANPAIASADVVVTAADRSKIAIAAASLQKDPSVSLNGSPAPAENILEGVSVGTFSTVKVNEVDHAIVVGSVLKTKEEVNKALLEAQKVDMMISLKSQDSEILEFNNLKEPNFEAEMIYNFFTPEEADIVSQEDLSQDPLLRGDIFQVPRYVSLKWNSVDVTEDLVSQENDTPEALNLRRDIFGKERGTKKPELLTRDGVKKEVVDIHKLDEAFDAVANHKTFSNSVRVVLDSSDAPNTISRLPIKINK